MTWMVAHIGRGGMEALHGGRGSRGALAWNGDHVGVVNHVDVRGGVGDAVLESTCTLTCYPDSSNSL